VAIDASNILDQSLMFKQKGFGIQEILYDPRWTFAFEVLKNLRYQPFGNMVIDWAHNVWLDVAHEVGIIPMIFLLIFSFHNIKLVKTIWLKFEWKSTSRLIALSTIFLINISIFLGTSDQRVHTALFILFVNHRDVEWLYRGYCQIRRALQTRRLKANIGINLKFDSAPDKSGVCGW